MKKKKKIKKEGIEVVTATDSMGEVGIKRAEGNKRVCGSDKRARVADTAEDDDDDDDDELSNGATPLSSTAGAAGGTCSSWPPLANDDADVGGAIIGKRLGWKLSVPCEFTRRFSAIAELIDRRVQAQQQERSNIAIAFLFCNLKCLDLYDFDLRITDSPYHKR
jgi:hypothetical protein